MKRKDTERIARLLNASGIDADPNAPPARGKPEDAATKDDGVASDGKVEQVLAGHRGVGTFLASPAVTGARRRVQELFEEHAPPDVLAGIGMAMMTQGEASDE